MNVVTRLAVEGKAKQGEKGAGIRMYLKVRVPLVVLRVKIDREARCLYLWIA